MFWSGTVFRNSARLDKASRNNAQKPHSQTMFSWVVKNCYPRRRSYHSWSCVLLELWLEVHTSWILRLTPHQSVQCLGRECLRVTEDEISTSGHPNAGGDLPLYLVFAFKNIRVEKYVKYFLKYAVSNVFLSRNKIRQKYVKIRLPIFFGNSFENLIHVAFVCIIFKHSTVSFHLFFTWTGSELTFGIASRKIFIVLIKPLTSIIRNSTYYFIRALNATKSLVTYFIQRK